MIGTATLLVAFAVNAGGCLSIADDHIRARDLAPAIEAFATLPPDTEIGYAPVPGTRRVYDAGDLRRLAQRFGLTLDPVAGVCLEWQLKPLDPAEVEAAMRGSLNLPEATIQIVGLSRFPAPPGPLNFRPSSLHKPPSGKPDAPVMWRGWIDVGRNRRFSIWARVRIKMPLSRVVAAEAIQAGQPIRAEQLKIETYEGFPLSRPDVTDVALVVGRISRRSFAAGTPISRALLRMPREVDRGDFIQVVARVGGAVIKGEGQAESGGKRGDTIRVRNPSSGLTFRATVVGPGTVSVAASGI